MWGCQLRKSILTSVQNVIYRQVKRKFLGWTFKKGDKKAALKMAISPIRVILGAESARFCPSTVVWSGFVGWKASTSGGCSMLFDNRVFRSSISFFSVRDTIIAGFQLKIFLISAKKFPWRPGKRLIPNNAGPRGISKTSKECIRIFFSIILMTGRLAHKHLAYNYL